MAYSEKQWEVVKAFYERGLSLSEITERDEVAIKDRAVISRKAKKEGWVKGEKATLLQKEIEAKQEVAEIKQQKATLNATELEVHETLVDERTRHLAYFNKASYKITDKAMQILAIKSDISPAEVRHLSEAVAKQREGVLGKAPDTAIQINNNVEQPKEIRIVAG